MVAHALDDGAHAAIAHGEAFAGHAADVGFAVRRPVQGHVADDDVLLRGEGRAGRRIQDDLAAGQALGEIVVGVARQFQRHAGRDEGRETLAGGPVEPEVDGVLGQAGTAVAPRDVAADDGAGHAVDVLDRQPGRHPLAALDGRRGEGEQRLPVERPLQPVVLADPAVAPDLGADVGPVQNVGIVQPARLPVRDGAARLDTVGAPDHVVQGAEAEQGHVLADFPRDEAHEVDGVPRVAREFSAQRGILGRHADRTGVEVADAHHDAAERHQRRGREPELLRPEQGGDDHVAPGLELAVGLHRDAAAQVVQHQRLVGFRQPQLPGQAGVLDARLRRGAGAAVVAADEHHVGMPFRHAGGNRAHADLGHQLDADARVRVGVLQVVDELRQIFDRIDVVVRRRGNQAHARGGQAHLGDPRIDLAPGQFAALAGLGALGHLDLNLARLGQVFARDAEAPGRDLFDGAVARVAVRVGRVAGRVLAALAGVALAADAVHGDRQRLVRLLADGAVRHGAGLEARGDRRDRLDLVERHRRRGRFERQQSAQGGEPLGLVVDQLRVLLERGVVVAAARLLQQVDAARVEQVEFAVPAELVLAVHVERPAAHRGGGERLGMLLRGFARDLGQADALHARRGPGEVAVDQIALEPDRLEDLRPAVGLDRRNTHLGHDLDDALDRGLDVAVDRVRVLRAGQQALADHVVEAGIHQVRVDRLRAVAEQQAEVVHLAGLAGFQHQPDPGPGARADQVVMQPGDGQQRRNRGPAGVHARVRQDQDRGAVRNRGVRGAVQRVQRVRQAGLAPRRVE